MIVGEKIVGERIVADENGREMGRRRKLELET